MVKQFFGDLRLTHNRTELIQLSISIVSLCLLIKRFAGARKRVTTYRASGVLPPVV